MRGETRGTALILKGFSARTYRSVGSVVNPYVAKGLPAELTFPSPHCKSWSSHADFFQLSPCRLIFSCLVRDGRLSLRWERHMEPFSSVSLRDYDLILRPLFSGMCSLAEQKCDRRARYKIIWDIIL